MTAATHARALVLETPRHLVEHAFELPEIGDDDGLLRVEACGLCGTDHEQYTGQLHPGRPFVPGHETVGIVEEVGAGGRRAVGRAARRPGGGAGVPVVPRVRRLPARRPPPLQAARDGHDVRVPGHRGPAGPLGRLRHPPLPRARLAAPPRPRRARPGARHGVQPARRRHPVGRHGARARPPATGWRCSARASAGLCVVRGGQGRRRRVRDGHRRRRARPPPPRGGRALRRRPGRGRDRGGPGRRLPPGHRVERRRRRRRRHRQRARRVRAGRGARPRRRHLRRRRHPRRARPRLPRRPPRLQGAAHHRRPRRRHRRLPRRPRPARRATASRSPS